MRKIISIMLCVLLAAMVLPITAYADDGDTVSITVAYTNDIHARNSNDDYNRTIGFPKLKTIVDQENADLLLDAGDLYHGQAFATVENGESIAQLINAVGYDGMTVGNHDWNYGEDQLKALEAISACPVMAGNVETDSNDNFFNTDYIIRDIGGVKVGVFGVVDPEVYGATNPTLLKGLQYTDMYAYADKMVKQLQSQDCDIIVALSHCVDYEKLASTVSGIDLLITGHLHIELSTVVNDTLVVQAGEYMQNVGIASLEYSKSEDKLISAAAKEITYEDSKAYEPNADITNLIAQINEEQKPILDEAVGSTSIDLDGEKFHVRAYETNLGRVITDTYINETGADIAIENGGGIRSSIKQGSITKRDVINVAPFGNIIVTKDVTGAGIKEMLENTIDLGIRNAKAYSGESTDWPSNDGSYVQIGGMTIKYDTSKPTGSRVISAMVGSEPLDLSKIYTIAGNNFILADKTYPAIASAPIKSEYTTCDDALTKFITSIGVEGSINNQRMIDITTPVEPTAPTAEPTQESSTAPTASITIPATATPTSPSATAPAQGGTTANNGSTAPTNTNASTAGKVATGDSQSIVMLIGIIALSLCTILTIKRKAVEKQ